LVFAVVGFVFATASAWVHYRVLTDPSYISPCDISAHFNCTQVYLSRFGSVRGVPVALGGIAWFALVALLAAFARPEAKDGAASSGAYIFALATIGLATILYLGYASFMILKTACVLCMGTYVCVIAIFVTSGLQQTTTFSGLPARLLRDLRAAMKKPAFLTVALLYIAGAASLLAFFPREGQQAAPAAPPPVSQDIEQRFADAWWQQPRLDLGVPADGAKVVVVKFNDWLCPACKAAEMMYKPVLEKYQKDNPGAVKYVIKDWPWNAECNFNIANSIHGHEGSCAAAASVRMAKDMGKGQAMIDWLFANQEHLDELGLTNGPAAATVKQGAIDVLGIKDWDAQYARKLPEIRRDVADGGALKVGSTPTFFINGVRAADSQGNFLPAQYFDLALKLEIAKNAAK
jgi:uncharacterized membrane protein/protein-disulfide isomerase